LNKKTGLTLGKFAPFHKGHELVIKTALKEVDELYIILYTSDLTTTPLQVRARWIKTLYPSVNIIMGFNAPQDEGNSKEVKKIQENYVLEQLENIKISHFYSSEFYGEHVSKALNAVDRRVDEARKMVPISGTAIRANSFANRQYLSDIVYKDLITKICFMGAPSTGKSTLTKVLADKYNTQFMPEYGAEYWLNHNENRRLNINQFENIPIEHNKREDILVQKANKYLFCDTCPITTYVFAIDYTGKAGQVLTKLADNSYKRYDLFFLCDTDIPYADTWDRSGFKKSLSMQDQIIDDLNERKIPYIQVSGTIEERVKKVESILNRYVKYSNLFELAFFDGKQVQI